MTNTMDEARPAEQRGDTTTPAVAEEHGGRWWRVPPVDRRGFVLWLLAYAAMTGVAIAIGLLIVRELGGVQSFDDRAARWFQRHRSDTWDALTWGGSFIADAYVKIPATAVLCLVFLWRWRRWTESALLIGALVLEVAVFVTSSMVVDRARPPIAQLDSIPPTGSFPSGHSAAAVAFYGAIAIVVFWHTHRRLARVIAVAVAVGLPLVVGTSRMYRGMHHVSDVAVGFLIGGLALWITWLVVHDGPAAQTSRTNPTTGAAGGPQSDHALS